MTATDSSAARVVAERMALAASMFLEALTPDQRRRANYAFPSDGERQRWFYTPTDHGGLPLGQMTPAQQQRAHQLVASGLSRAGYVVASTIIGLENTLDAKEGWRVRFARDVDPSWRGRDPLQYFVSIFGDPAGGSTWGWRFGGHHISLHFTIADGRVVAPTPTFFGAHPAEAPFVGPGMLRPLAGEEDLGRELLHALDADQRSVVQLSSVAPHDIVTGNRSAVEPGVLPPANHEIFRETLTGAALERSLTNSARLRETLGQQDAHLEAVRHTSQPKGLPASQMTPGQRDVLTALIRQYIGRLPDEIAEEEGARLTGATLDAIHFAWAGSDRRREPHYYRLQGPRFLVEYDNVQDDTNHIHSVWRDPENDFGAMALAEHYARAH